MRSHDLQLQMRHMHRHIPKGKSLSKSPTCHFALPAEWRMTANDGRFISPRFCHDRDRWHRPQMNYAATIHHDGAERKNTNERLAYLALIKRRGTIDELVTGTRVFEQAFEWSQSTRLVVRIWTLIRVNWLIFTDCGRLATWRWTRILEMNVWQIAC